MNIRAKALANLYQRNKVAKEGLKQAVLDNVITPEEYQEITKEQYVEQKSYYAGCSDNT